MKLADIAPRLARARDEWERDYAERMARRRILGPKLLAQQRLVAHRDLQLQRAQARLRAKGPKGQYIVERRRKLKRAERELRRLSRRWEEVAAA